MTACERQKMHEGIENKTYGTNLHLYAENDRGKSYANPILRKLFDLRCKCSYPCTAFRDSTAKLLHAVKTTYRRDGQQKRAQVGREGLQGEG